MSENVSNNSSQHQNYEVYIHVPLTHRLLYWFITVYPKQADFCVKYTCYTEESIKYVPFNNNTIKLLATQEWDNFEIVDVVKK